MHAATKPGTATKLPVTGLDTYFGGKGGPGTYHKIICQIRPCEVFVELFLGGGSITRWMRRAAHHVGIDLNPDVVRLWEAMGYEWLDLRNISAFSYLEYLNTCSDLSKTVLYVDPPYLGSTRKSDTGYKFDMLGEADHLRLLTLLVRLSQRPDAPDIIISTYPNALYKKALKGWHYEEFESQTRNGKATEGLYRNYHDVTALHDPRFVGAGYRERQRMRKMQKRWVAKFNALPTLERQALFSVLAADTSNYAAASPAPVASGAVLTAGDGGHSRQSRRGNQAPQLGLFGSTSAGAGVGAPVAPA